MIISAIVGGAVAAATLCLEFGIDHTVQKKKAEALAQMTAQQSQTVVPPQAPAPQPITVNAPIAGNNNEELAAQLAQLVDMMGKANISLQDLISQAATAAASAAAEDDDDEHADDPGAAAPPPVPQPKGKR